jgi:hypothetical protein
MGSRRRGATRATIAVVATALMSACSGSDQGSAPREVAWPTLRTHEIAQIETEGSRTWVLTRLPIQSGDNLFSVERDTLAVKRVATYTWLQLIVAGEGRLWGLSNDGNQLLVIDESTHEVRRRKLSMPCDVTADPNGAAALRMLWLSCNGRISAYKPSGGAGEVVRAPRSSRILASDDGVWVVADGALVGIAGAAKGRRIDVPGGADARLWQSRGNEAWAIDVDAENKGVIRVQLSSGAVSRFPIPTGSDEIEDIGVSTHEIWVALRDEPIVLRLDRADPTHVVQRIDLRSESPSDDALVFVTAGPSYAWINMYGAHKTTLLLAKD